MFAVDKPRGVASVPSPNIGEDQTIQGSVRYWMKAGNKDYKSYLLNRLDRDTSGIILFGKYPRDREALEGIFKDQKAEKTYLALVKGTPKFHSSTISFPIETRGADSKTTLVPAVTHYTVLKKLGILSMLEVKIETGRKHQIRKHLAMIDHPLVLDKIYGDAKFNRTYLKLSEGAGRYFLHTWKFKFHHPLLNKDVEISAFTRF